MLTSRSGGRRAARRRGRATRCGRVGRGQVERHVARPAGQRLGERLRRSSRRATRTSSAPGSRASRFAAASPMPLDAPVITALIGSSTLENLFESSDTTAVGDSAYCPSRMAETPELLDKLLRTGAPSGYEAPAAEIWREAASFAAALQPTGSAPRSPGSARRPAARRRRPHRRDRPRRHPHRREGLPLLRPDRRLGPADPGRPAGRGARQGRPRPRRRRPQADPPARAPSSGRRSSSSRASTSTSAPPTATRPAAWSGSATRS